MPFVEIFKPLFRLVGRSTERFLEQFNKTTLFEATINHGHTKVSIRLQSFGKTPDIKYQTVFSLIASDMTCFFHLSDDGLVNFANNINMIVDLKSEYAKFTAAASNPSQNELQ